MNIGYKDERLAVFIDGANLYNAARALNFDIDYKQLLDYFREQGRLIRAFYYTALVDDTEYSPIRPLIDWLDYNGYTMVTKPTKEFTDSNGQRRRKGNMDVELTIDALEISDRLDHVVIASGDGDFQRLVETIQRRGVRVTVLSTIRSQPPMIADELRRQADVFVELDKIRDRISRGHNSAPPPQQAPRRERPAPEDAYQGDDDVADFDDEEAEVEFSKSSRPAFLK